MRTNSGSAGATDPAGRCLDDIGRYGPYRQQYECFVAFHDRLLYTKLMNCYARWVPSRINALSVVVWAAILVSGKADVVAANFMVTDERKKPFDS